MNKEKFEQLKNLKEIKKKIFLEECQHFWVLFTVSPKENIRIWYCSKCRKIENAYLIDGE